MRDKFIQTLAGIARKDPRVILITGDLGFKVLDGFKKEFPRQFINAGVSEQNMTMLATGMAQEGRIVFTYSIGNFPTLRCLEMIRNDAAYHEANVKIVCIGGGFSYGALGPSHHASEDITVMRSLSNVTTIVPTGLWETEEATRAIYSRRGTCYLRLDKDRGIDIKNSRAFRLGVPRRVKVGKDLAILATGGIISEVMASLEVLAKRGIHPSIFSVHTLNPIQERIYIKIAKAHKALLTVEENSVRGGLGSMILETLAKHGAAPKSFVSLGIENAFTQKTGSQKYLRKTHKIDASSIAKQALMLLGET